MAFEPLNSSVRHFSLLQIFLCFPGLAALDSLSINGFNTRLFALALWWPFHCPDSSVGRAGD